MSDDPRRILLSFAERVAGAIVDELREQEVDSIFVAGSVGRGDVAAFRGPRGIEIYSDVDVFVVLRRPRSLEAVRGRARRAAARVPRDGEGYRIVPEPGIGVFSEEDFLAQGVRPGTVEIADSHVLLHGKGNTLKLAAKFSAPKIDPTEALYLIENRLIELATLMDRLEEGRAEGFRRYVRYARAKSCLDAVSAALIAAGSFHPSRDERMRRLRGKTPDDGASRFIPEGAMACIDRCHGDLADLQKTLESGDVDDTSFRDEVESVLLGVWERVAVRVCPEVVNDRGGLVEWRCKRGRWIGNSRELCVLAKRMRVARARVLLGAGTLARLSPVDTLRVSGLAEALIRKGEDARDGGRASRDFERRYVGVLDGLTRVLGFGSGPVFKRARRVLRETT